MGFTRSKVLDEGVADSALDLEQHFNEDGDERRRPPAAWMEVPIEQLADGTDMTRGGNDGAVYTEDFQKQPNVFDGSAGFGASRLDKLNQEQQTLRDSAYDDLDFSELNRSTANRVIARVLSWMGETQYKPTSEEFRPMRKQFLMSLSGLIGGTWLGRFGLLRGFPVTRTFSAPLQWGLGFTLLGYPASLLAITCSATSTTREILQQQGILGAQAREAYKAVMTENAESPKAFFSFFRSKTSDYSRSFPPPPPTS